MTSENLLTLANEVMIYDSFEDYEIDLLVQILKLADDRYHNAKDLLYTDQQYDSLRRYVELSDPENSYFIGVGSTVPSSRKVKLPHTMGSLDQIYENEISRWIDKNQLHAAHFVITEKLDGTSCLIMYDSEGRLSEAYTRGDGVEGVSIIQHLKQFPNIPKENFALRNLAIRGEIIFNRHTFSEVQSKVKNRAGKEYKNPRNAVAGLMNADSNDVEVYKWLKFIAYDIMNLPMAKKMQLSSLSDNRFDIPKYCVLTSDEMTDVKLTSLIEEYKANSDYELDGIVIDVDEMNFRYSLSHSRDTLNPACTVKYKVGSAENYAETTVRSVEFQVSKSGYLKPTVVFDPIELEGVTITKATGFNAGFISNNKIGPGAVIGVVRSGQVIPFITKTISPMPEDDICYHDWFDSLMYETSKDEEWGWNETGVDVMLIDPAIHTEVAVQQTIEFFASIDAPNLKEGSIRTVFEKYPIKNSSEMIAKMIKMDRDEWVDIIGANGNKIYEGLKVRLTDIPLHLLLGSTTCFGRGVGVRKIKKLVQVFKIEEIAQFTQLSLNEICSVEGFDIKTAKKIIAGMDNFTEFYEMIESHVTLGALAKVAEGIMTGHKVCFTGVRSKELEEQIVAEGGEIASGVSKKTTILVCADPTSNSGKMGKAKELGIRVIGIDQMKEMLC